MIRKLTPIGDGLGLVIERSILGACREFGPAAAVASLLRPPRLGRPRCDVPSGTPRGASGRRDALATRIDGLATDRPAPSAPIRDRLPEELSIDRDTPLELRAEGGVLVVRPVRNAHTRRVQTATERMMQAHEETLRKLAE
jgi:hypothetical protein